MKKTQILKFLAFFLIALVCVPGVSSSQGRSRGRSFSPPQAAGRGEVTTVEGDSLTVRFESRGTRTVYLEGLDIVRLVEAKEEDLRAGDNV